MRRPRVSIGLAVYNGERYLEEAIASILNQTFSDFELIISDNASTDSTAEICHRFAAQDARIRYFRNPTNIGGTNNENLTFGYARGEYFRWAAHDDVLAPTLLERCVEVLDRHPEVVLCHTAIVEIDANGKPFGSRSGREGTQPRPHQRFRALSYRHYPCEATYGLMRADLIKTTRLQQNYTGSDRTFLCELALHGPFALVDEPLFYKRYHERNVYRDWRGRMAWFFPDLVKTGRITFPNWLQLFDYFETMKRVELPRYEQVMCGVWIGRWVMFQAKGLAWDLVAGLYMALHSREWRARFYAEEDRWL